VIQIRRALLSVSDKRGLIDFARSLHAMGVDILSTGGTAAALREQGIPVRQVSDFTGFPEILDGRVKTLHPKIHGALLAVNDNPDHQKQIREHGIEPIDMVVVNLYPFEQTVSRASVTLPEAVEQIDIGGPSMLRSAAKNFRHRAVVVNPDRYPSLLEELRANSGALREDTCFALAREVFHHTAAYDAAIGTYLDRQAAEEPHLPPLVLLAARKEMDLRYGENPHQRAALYGTFGSLFAKLHGKELSYNNIIDISAAAALVAEFDEPTVAIIKHTNPCGVGSAPTLADAYSKAFATDTKAPFGGIVAMNRPLDLETAQRINEIFTEVILAPGIPGDVLEFLKKKKDRRIIQINVDLRSRRDVEVRSIPGGFLVEEADYVYQDDGFRVVTRRQPSPKELEALRFAWRVVKHVKSNAIVFALADRTVGIGAGQMSRIDSATIAARKAGDAGLALQGSVVGSDAYFPFADGLLEAVHAGSTAVIQPGGSIRDDEVITAADEHDIAMVFTGRRHFKH
jgi:phosphoribosylaminoimidazolecarboxamide formyltransferase / IMP cyclohydrolase